ncbi:hypothetical protein ALP58_02874 [Pseudomonas savastanoi]|uniref:Uncharacterized protein n=2 Tax=Pseudomonas syringae group TaxID=136849 RepID=A0A0P9MAS9_PSESX|nr:Uncharacterized protein ALO79_03097 [Pseudomonas syringae pv. castaneae]RMS88268.1 hypothetical protein ALP58_02874 [Pseudomonas savastanoi]
MRALAELSFDFVWHLMFTDDDQLDQDLAVRSLENLSDYFSAMSDEEKRAFIAVAHERKARLFAVPDADGYSPMLQATKTRHSFLIMWCPENSSSSLKSPRLFMPATAWYRFAATELPAAASRVQFPATWQSP